MSTYSVRYLSVCCLMLGLISQEAGARDELLPVHSFSEVLDALDVIPHRSGPPPITPPGIPHQQHNQNAPVVFQQALTSSANQLPGVYFAATPYSLPGSVGWRIDVGFSGQSQLGSYIPNSREFLHQHQPKDGSMHMLLPDGISNLVIEKGWGVIHPWTDRISGKTSEYLMVYGPRSSEELLVIWTIALASYYQAIGVIGVSM